MFFLKPAGFQLCSKRYRRSVSVMTFSGYAFVWQVAFDVSTGPNFRPRTFPSLHGFFGTPNAFEDQKHLLDT